jgi:hypothetical protein
MEESVIQEIYAYKAPFLIDKLVKDNIVDTPEEGEGLFLEVKRWLILIHSDLSKNWEMYSLRIDEVWHQFVLYSGEYFKFCTRFFGAFVPHSPGNAPKTERTDNKEIGSFDEFRTSYQEMFHVPVADAWMDWKSVTMNRRVINYFVNKLALREKNGMIDLVSREGNTLLSVNDIAGDAISYIMRSPAFYVREVPGNLTNEELLALIEVFVEYDLLRIAS